MEIEGKAPKETGIELRRGDKRGTLELNPKDTTETARSIEGIRRTVGRIGKRRVKELMMSWAEEQYNQAMDEIKRNEEKDPQLKKQSRIGAMRQYIENVYIADVDVIEATNAIKEWSQKRYSKTVLKGGEESRREYDNTLKHVNEIAREDIENQNKQYRKGMNHINDTDALMIKAQENVAKHAMEKYVDTMEKIEKEAMEVMKRTDDGIREYYQSLYDNMR